MLCGAQKPPVDNRVTNFCDVLVMFAYEQCLLCLGHHPDIWYEAATYLEQSSKILTEKGVCDYILRLIKYHRT